MFIVVADDWQAITRYLTLHLKDVARKGELQQRQCPCCDTSL